MSIQPPSINNIKVGYISQTEGYIQGLTISQANAYENLNPGTVYIFVDGDGKVRYLTIDGVNNLSVNDLQRTDPCSVAPKPCGPPIINFFGGGGIGAIGNAVIDENGVILAVDIESGGFGYNTPPQIQIIDPCDTGSGAVIEAEIENGSVSDVIVVDGGSGYNPPPAVGPQYPVVIEITDVIVQNPGINYNCGVDELTLCVERDGVVVKEPNGTVLSYTCDPFGRITKVQVVKKGTFTQLPTVCVNSRTGVNAKFTPVFNVVRVPEINAEDDNRKVIQVYDLVGLTIQGYVGGKPYYGKIYYENDIKFAGVQGTGRPVRVYDTKSASIEGSQQSVTGDSVRIVGADSELITPAPAEPVETTQTIDIAPRIQTQTPAPTPAPTPTPSTTPTPTPAPAPAPAPSPSPSPPPSSPGGGGYGGY